MNSPKTPKQGISRRDFLRLSGLGALGVVAGSAIGFPSITNALGKPTSGVAEPDVEINLEAVFSQTPILPGLETQVWRYEAELVKGPAGTVQPIPNTYLGPSILLRPGQNVRINFTNRLTEETIVHWHGLHVPEAADGHPRLVIGPNETYVYEFQVLDRPGMYWYHPHPHGRTGPQAYKGLAGLILISDGTETGLGLPTGDQDLPLVLQDRTFDSQNQLVYYYTQMMGFLGDQILVNGQPNASLTVDRTAYRFRILNGSNSRIYKLAWPDGTPLIIIGTDGGLLDAPVHRNYVTLSPGERIDLLVDFSQWPAGSTQTLRSLAFSGGGFGGGYPILPNGADFPIMTFQIKGGATATPSPTPTATPSSVVPTAYMPLIFSPDTGGNSQLGAPAPRSDFRADQAEAVQADRSFYLYMQFGRWTINGRTFQMEAVAPDEIVELGTEEVWEFVNNWPGGGMGMMMGMPHPMHIHDLQFRVISRQAPTDPFLRANWETVKDGYVDGGWKDTILLMPGESVQVQMEFKDFTGLFLYHCHNLEHEDMGMMRNYRIVASE